MLVFVTVTVTLTVVVSVFVEVVVVRVVTVPEVVCPIELGPKKTGSSKMSVRKPCLTE